MIITSTAPDTHFYLKRARDECELASAAHDDRARSAHLKLLRSYLDRPPSTVLRTGDDA